VGNSFYDIYVNKIFGDVAECDKCNGSGIVQYDNECKKCNGNGFVVLEKKTQKINPKEGQSAG
jgi:DnaJ-class molecular chaperone